MTAPEGKREFRILGPLEAREDGRALAIGTGKQRALLALLLLDAGDVVSTDRLIDALWGERPPASALNSVHVYVSQLRKVLGEGCLITSGHGYLLTLDPEQVDLGRFERLLGEGRELLAEGEAKRASNVLQAGLALWRGPPLADLASEPFAQGEIARLEELHLAALEERIEADLALGRLSELVPELEALVRANPLRERLCAQLMLALYRSGRQAEALETYRRARMTLVEEVGLEPGRRLQELERAILSQDPTLDLPAPATEPKLALRPERRKRVLLLCVGVLVLAAAIAGTLVAITGGSGLSSIRPTSLGVIDPTTNKLVDEIPLGFKSSLIAAGEGHIWVADPGGSTLVKIDPRTGHVDRRGVPAPGIPIGLAVGFGSVWLAVLRENRKFVLELDPQFAELRREIAVGKESPAPGEAVGGSLALGDEAIWLIDRTSGSLWRIPRNGRPSKLAEGLSASSVAITSEAAWVAGLSGLTKLDPDTGFELKEISVGSPPGEVDSVARGLGAVWFTSSAAGTLWRIDPRSDTVTRPFPVGKGPSAVAPGEGAVWVANSRDGSVTRVGRRGKVEAIRTGSSPAGVVAAYGKVWVTSGDPRR
jgi:DNA-binding SARP family transcriptional activator/streptogramin lyase